MNALLDTLTDEEAAALGDLPTRFPFIPVFLDRMQADKVSLIKQLGIADDTDAPRDTYSIDLNRPPFTVSDMPEDDRSIFEAVAGVTVAQLLAE
jgi:hypothetical protein